jgi:Ca-activated chloride channel family protein
VNIAHPAWLLLLALLPVLAVLVWLMARLRNRQWTAFVADRLRPSLLKGSSPLPRWFALISLLIAAACLIIALTRPFADAGSRTEKIMGRNVFLALDISRSMRVADVKPDRLSQAKIIAYELIDSMPNERIGLIGFAGNAALCAPLTIDHAAVRETIDQMDESWITLGGTNLTKAVQLAVESLRETGQRNNALILLSDGEKHEKGLDDAIQAARQAGVFIITIGIGTEDGDYVPNTDFPGNRMVDLNGKPVLSRLQKDVLTKLATETNGLYATAGAGTHIPTLVRSAINRLEAFEIEGRERTIKVEFYQWLTFPAVLFLLFSILSGTRWRKITATPATALLLLACTVTLPAAPADDALRALQSGDYPRATSIYQNLAKTSKSAKRRAGFHLGAAIAAYRSGDLLAAQRAYSQAILSPDSAVTLDAHLGYGNTLFQSGWKRLFESLYPTDPDPIPEMSAFDEKIRSLLQSESEEGSSFSNQIEFVVKSWTDAVRHYDTVLSRDSSLTEAAANRDLTLRYLKRLAELLKEEQEQTKESLPDPQPPPDDSGQEGEEGEEEGDKGDQKDGSGEKGDPKQQDGSTDPSGDPEPSDGEPDPDQPPKQPKSPGDSDTPPGKTKPRADESPEDHARRQLKENADLERGPLTPGRREFLPPEKDW